MYLGGIESLFRFLESEVLLLVKRDGHFDARKSGAS